MYFQRKANKITEINPNGPNTTTEYPSISKAKKASREIQMSNDGGLGRGVLSVVVTPKSRQHPNNQKSPYKKVRYNQKTLTI
jgi:hypothetical protein